LRFEMRSEIPIAAGLGSSAAAIIAGLMAAEHLYELAIERDELLAKAAALEGHPDNVAAALFGGFVACSATDGVPRATRFDPPEGVEGVLVIPSERVATDRARGALPPEIPLGDAVANVAAAVELVLGIERADLTLIARGLRDRIHQPRRAPLYPRSMEILAEAERLGAIGATISGSGPSVLVWTYWQSTGKVVDAIKQRAGAWAEVRCAPFTPLGADVAEL
jgi:homoserine kinase